MLATIITILFLTGGASAGLLYDFGDVKKQLKAVVVDEERKDQALDVLKEIKSRAKAEGKGFKGLSKDFREEFSASDMTDAQLAAIGTQFIDNTRAYYSDLLDLRFELREHLTPEEWAATFVDEGLAGD